MFEVFRRSMGRAGMCCSQPARVDYISPKRWAVGIRKFEKSPLRNLLKFAPTLGSVKSSIPHGTWRFYFFPNIIFAKIRLYMDLYIHHWEFSLMKK
jgi:hypothetical protein